MKKLKDNMDNQTQWDIVAKYLNGEKLNADEQNYINSAASNKEIQQLIDDSKQTFQNIDRFFTHKQFDTNAAWVKVERNTQKQNKIFNINLRLIRYAAILIVAFGLSVMFFKIYEKETFHIVQTAKTDIVPLELNLPDGSTVLLNTGTMIKYAKQFNKNERKVKLNGEAFFNIAHNAGKPFIVETDAATIEVLGTEFNVNGHRNSTLVEVIVVSGKVILKGRRTDNESIVLTKGEKGLFDKKTKVLLKAEQIEENELSWASGEIVFREAKLIDVLSKLEDVFGLNISIESGVDINQKITATFKQQKASYVLEVVALTLNLDLEETEKNGYLIRNKQ